MNPSVRIARRACEAAKARQAVVVWFDEAGRFAVASYGETKAECSAVKPLCNAIADAIDAGKLPCPGDGATSPPERIARERAIEAARAIVEHDDRANAGGELKPYEGVTLRGDLRSALAALDAARGDKP